MWFPVEIHSEGAVNGGLPAALREHLRLQPHVIVVADRKLVNQPLGNDPGELDSVLDEFTSCSAAYVGTHHMSPAAPFGAFKIASDLGIAYLELLLDANPWEGNAKADAAISVAIHSFVHCLFEDHLQVDRVILPFALTTPFELRFVQTEESGSYHLTRP